MKTRKIEVEVDEETYLKIAAHAYFIGLLDLEGAAAWLLKEAEGPRELIPVIEKE